MAGSVLVVDNEDDAIFCLQRLLSHDGYMVETCERGADALERLRQRPVDVVVLDRSLADGTGFEICQTIRANADWRAIGIVMKSARALASERDKAFGLGADAYLTKPFTGDDLRAAVATAFARVPRPAASSSSKAPAATGRGGGGD